MRLSLARERGGARANDMRGLRQLRERIDGR